MKKKSMTIVFGVLGLIVLAGAAFMAPRLFSQSMEKSSSNSASAASEGKGGKASVREIEVTRLPVDGIPQRDYELAGTVSRVKDNSIFIEPAFLDESEVEIVVTQDTKIFLYIGEDTISEDQDGNPTVTQMKVEPITIDDLVNNDILSVWAEKRGDRYIAEAIRVLH